MKRFINIGTQMYVDDTMPSQFAFYCTVVDSFERFNDEDLWETAEAFTLDYLESNGKELKRYLSLIPKTFFIKQKK